MNEALRLALDAGRHVNIRDLADMLNMSPRSLYRAARRGDFPVTTIGERMTVPAHVARRLLCLDAEPKAAA